jgi:hypothetical protein
MGKGYAEGSAVEERLAELERAERGETDDGAADRLAVYGSTAENTAKHFIGWIDDVDPDALFASGEAWGISVIRRRTG